MLFLTEMVMLWFEKREFSCLVVSSLVEMLQMIYFNTYLKTEG